MARTDLIVTPVPRGGLNLAAALPNPAAVDGHKFMWSDKRQIRLKNTDSTPKTVTLILPGTVDGQQIEDRPYTVPASIGDVLIPALPAVYRQSDGTVWLDVSATTGLSIAILEEP